MMCRSGTQMQHPSEIAAVRPRIPSRASLSLDNIPSLGAGMRKGNTNNYSLRMSLSLSLSRSLKNMSIPHEVIYAA